MGIDNIFKVLPFIKEGIHYQICILKRKKDFPELKNDQNHRLVKIYYISSQEELLSKYEEIKTIASVFKARVYINLLGRDISTIGNEIILKTAQIIKSQGSLNSIYHKAFEECKKDKKYWLFDIDKKDFDFSQFEEIPEIHIHSCLETPQGFHLIVEPFNKERIKIHQNLFYNFEIKKFPITLLYYDNRI
jgi:hypothetical protein